MTPFCLVARHEQRSNVTCAFFRDTAVPCAVNTLQSQRRPVLVARETVDTGELELLPACVGNHGNIVCILSVGESATSEERCRRDGRALRL